MGRLIAVVLVLAVAVGALGYWRGWFTVSKDGKYDVQVDRADFAKDKKDFGKTVNEKAKTLKADVASLWEKSEKLTGDDKVTMQKELSDLKKKHERLEQQIKELDEAGQNRFDSIKRDLSKNLEEVEKKIEELTKKLEKGKDKQ